MKKQILFIFTAVLALAFLCSCGSSDQNAYAAWAALSGSSYLDYNSGYIAPDTATDTNGDGETTDNTGNETPAETPAEQTYTNKEASEAAFTAITYQRTLYNQDRVQQNWIPGLTSDPLLDLATQNYAVYLQDHFEECRNKVWRVYDFVDPCGVSYGDIGQMCLTGDISPEQVAEYLHNPASSGENVFGNAYLYNPDYTHVSASRTQDENGVIYWAVLFVSDEGVDG